MAWMKPITADSLGERVASQLREMIVLRRLAPGEHLGEDALSGEFGVSRGPIRDALKDLETEGLVETRRNRVYVREFAEQDIRDLYHLRKGIELLAVDDLTRRGPDGVDWEPLTASVSAMRRAADHPDATQFALDDQAFHHHLYLATGNHRLIRVWGQIRPTFELLLSLTVAQDPDLHPSYESHAAILDLLIAGDGDAAKTELAQHLIDALDRMILVHQHAIADQLEHSNHLDTPTS